MKNVPIYKIKNYDDNTRPFQELFYIKKLQDHVCQYDFINHSHSHDFYLVIVCTKGSGKHLIDFEEFDFEPGKVFILKPGQIHSWELSDDIEGYILFFKSDFYFTSHPNSSIVSLPLLRNLVTTSDLLLANNQKDELIDIYEKLYNTYHSDLRSKNLIFSSYLNILIHLLHDWVDTIEIKQTNSKYFYLSQFETLLEEFFKNEHSVVFYAKKIGVCPEHLNRVCKHFLNKNAKKIIAERITLEAKRLLCKEDLTVQLIADILCFSDISNFVKFFKRETTMTPNNFRKSII